MSMSRWDGDVCWIDLELKQDHATELGLEPQWMHCRSNHISGREYSVSVFGIQHFCLVIIAHSKQWTLTFKTWPKFEIHYTILSTQALVLVKIPTLTISVHWVGNWGRVIKVDTLVVTLYTDQLGYNMWHIPNCLTCKNRRPALLFQNSHCSWWHLKQHKHKQEV